MKRSKKAEKMNFGGIFKCVTTEDQGRIKGWRELKDERDESKVGQHNRDSVFSRLYIYDRFNSIGSIFYLII